jgi:hypothetical protein
MYSRKDHAERLVSTFGFDCKSCRAAILRDLNSPDIGAVYVGQRDDGLYKIGATSSPPLEHLSDISRVSKRQHTLVHTIAALDAHALEGHLHRRLDAFLADRREWYALPPGVLGAICATRHICEVPSPYLNKPTTIPGFNEYIGAVDEAIRAAVS